jgi:hypothetical protein
MACFSQQELPAVSDASPLAGALLGFGAGLAGAALVGAALTAGMSALFGGQAESSGIEWVVLPVAGAVLGWRRAPPVGIERRLAPLRARTVRLGPAGRTRLAIGLWICGLAVFALGLVNPFGLLPGGLAARAVAVFALAPVWWVSFGPLCRWLFDEPAHGEDG